MPTYEDNDDTTRWINFERLQNFLLLYDQPMITRTLPPTDQQPQAYFLQTPKTRARLGGKSAHIMTAGIVPRCQARTNLNATPFAITQYLSANDAGLRHAASSFYLYTNGRYTKHMATFRIPTYSSGQFFIANYLRPTGVWRSSPSAATVLCFSSLTSLGNSPRSYARWNHGAEITQS